MHALVAAILLRAAGLDALNADPQAQPPDGELAQAEQGMGRGEGDAVVGANRRGKPKLLECALKDGKRAPFLDGFQSFAGQQVARAVVRDGQWVAVLLVAEAELAFEVGAPQLVRRLGVAEGRPLRLVASALAALHQAVAIQDAVDRADRGRRQHGELFLELLLNLRRTPGAVLLLEPQDRLLDLEGRLVGMPIGAAIAILEPFDARFSIAVVDLVARLAADAELTTGDAHLLAFEDTGDETKSLVHAVTLIPRHLESPPNAEMCNLCARNKTVPMCPKAQGGPQ
jgi:hypothetical protein